jgi:putative addiction module component (TIGR02574 family)
MRVHEIPGLDQMSTEEKILLVEELWDSISENQSNVAVPQSHIDELSRRVKHHASTPGNLLTLDQLRARIDARK